MTIRLPKDVESSIEAAVHGGYFASVDDAMDQAARLLLKDLEQRQPAAKPIVSDDRAAGRQKAKPLQRKSKSGIQQPITEEEFLKHLVEIGLMTQLPDTAADFDDPDDQPITIKGEPLSETIIRERR
jgi:Arc/MetJ-type ribon-helix-helix transcriptional regulator